jgi:hypothetical protein
MSYLIYNKVNGLFWSNRIGWVDRFAADVFSTRDKKFRMLPIDGEWLKYGADFTDEQGTMKNMFEGWQ